MEYEYQHEYGAHERTFGRNMGEELGTQMEKMPGNVHNKLSELNRLLDKNNQTDAQKFSVAVAMVCDDISRYVNDINEGFKQEAISLALRVTHPAYRNPLGFITGLYIINDLEISKRRFEDLKTQLRSQIDDEDISPADMLRYARFILKTY